MVTEDDKVFKALTDPSRRQLLDLLYEKGGLSLGALCEHFAMSRQAVTKHLVLLEAANLVVTRKQGREAALFNPIPIHDIYIRWIGKFEQNRLAAINALKTALEENEDD